MSSKERLTTFVSEQLAAGRTDVDVNKDSLVDAGIIDSVGILKLVDFIEKELGVRITDDDLVPENFDTLDDIDRLITSKQS